MIRSMSGVIMGVAGVFAQVRIDEKDGGGWVDLGPQTQGVLAFTLEKNVSTLCVVTGISSHEIRSLGRVFLEVDGISVARWAIVPPGLERI